MGSEDYWKERTVSWTSVGTGYAIAAFVLAGLLLAEVISFGIRQLEGQGVQAGITPIRGHVSGSLEPEQDAEPTADQTVIVDTLPDKERFLLDCPRCE